MIAAPSLVVMSVVGKFFRFTIRKPVAKHQGNLRRFLKLLIMPGAVKGKIAVAAKNRIWNNHLRNGDHTHYHSQAGKIAAVNKSRIDWDQHRMIPAYADRAIESPVLLYRIIRCRAHKLYPKVSEFGWINLPITRITPALALTFSLKMNRKSGFSYRSQQKNNRWYFIRLIMVLISIL